MAVLQVYPSFTYNGIKSTDKGVVLHNYPAPVKPQRSFVELTSTDMHGSHINLYGYKAYDTDIQITLLDMAQLDDIVAWLDGSGEMIFNNQPTRIYRVAFINQIDYEQLLRWRTAKVTIRVQPFKYDINNQSVSLLTGTATTLANPGNVYCRPTIMCNCGSNTTFNITVNNELMCTIENVNGKVYVDSNKLETYNESGVLLNRHKTGEYPILLPGSNSVNVTKVSGSISTATITRNTRWI